jgi:dienelactone hydrolase
MPQIREEAARFTSGGRAILLDCFCADGARQLPAVIALHGSGGGLRYASEPARLLTAQGYAVYILHYFDRTATVWADQENIRRNFVAWMETVRDAIAYVSQRPEVDSERIALLGFSLGAYLALSVAAQDPRVRAVVEFSGGVPEELEHQVRRLPPVLILHGSRDDVVPVSEADRLRALLERTGTEYQAHIYPEAGHGFSTVTLLDAGMRALAFLNQHLRQRNRAA